MPSVGSPIIGLGVWPLPGPMRWPGAGRLAIVPGIANLLGAGTLARSSMSCSSVGMLLTAARRSGLVRRQPYDRPDG